MTRISPYLTFDGNCKEAFDFYRSVFGGEFMYVGYFKDMPPDPKYPIQESEMNLIMHISLPIGNGAILMGSDSTRGHGKPVIKGTNFSISLHPETKDEATRIFNTLAKEGEVEVPLNDTFWGSYYGMLIDQFGIQWMINWSNQT
ncbi:MAG: VOC family protein [Bacteroidia bacterium]|nr:VOC family protein [Bacteroidia bacterium]